MNRQGTAGYHGKTSEGWRRSWLRGGQAVLTGLVLLGFAACSHGPGPETAVVSYDDAVHAGAKTKWQLPIGLATANHETIQNLWKVGDSLYVLTSENELHSINATTGTTNWHRDLGQQIIQVYRPQETDNGGLLIVTRGTMTLLDKKTGELIKTAPLGFAAVTDPVVIGNTVWVGGGADFFHGCWIDLLGREHWKVGNRDDTFVAAPVTAFGRNVILASKKGLIWNLNGTTGEVVWSNRKTSGNVLGGLAADPRLVYIPSMDCKLFAFELATGNPAWDVRLEGKLNQAAMPVGQTVLIVGGGQGLYAVSADKGEPKWFLRGVTQLVSHSADKVLARDEAGNLLVINLESGVLEQKIPVPYAARFAVNRSDATAYVITTDGRLAAVELTGK